MRRQILMILSILMVAVVAFAQSKKGTIVTIKNMGKAPVPASQPSLHKQHDAEIFRTAESSKNNNYTVVYYQKEQDTLKYHKANYGSKYVLDKAEYTWNNDTIAIRLYNTATKKEVRFKAFGHGSSSSMMTD